MADVEIAIGNQSIRFHESRQAESRHAEKGARPRVSLTSAGVHAAHNQFFQTRREKPRK